MHKDPVKTFQTCLIYAYLLLGLIGSVLIVDDLEAIRLGMLTYVGLPLLILYTFFSWAYPNWPQKLPKTKLFLLGSLMLIFSWGNYLLLNAAGEDQKPVQVNSTAFNYNAQKGTFGTIYQWRF